MSRCYNEKINGYPFGVVELSSGFICFQVPLGKNKRDKEMFDKLVYYNQHIYNGYGKDKKEIVKNIKQFIKDWKANN